MSEEFNNPEPDSTPDAEPTVPAPDTTPTPVPTSPPAPEVVVGNHKRRRSKRWLFILIIVLIAAGAAAYLVHNHKSAKTVTSSTAAKHDIAQLNFGVVDQLSQAYPLGANTTATMADVNSQLFEGLVRYQQLTKIVPQLAASWYNPDNTTWVFNLRHGVKFHSGRAFTAQDVKSSLDYAIAHQNDPDVASSLAVASTIKEVDVMNDYQVKIKTDGPDPTLLNRLTQLFIFDSKATLGDPNAGTGPYMIKAGTKPTSGSMDLAAVNNYWGGHIYTKAVHIGASANADQLATATSNGKYELAGDFTAGQLSKLSRFQDVSVDDFGVSFLGLNTLKSGSPLSDLTARQAASYALDIPAILKAGGVSGKAASQLIPPDILGHDPSIKSVPYDPAKAKQLLATVKNANSPLTLSFPAGDEGQVNEIAKELNAVGFNVKTSPQPDVGSLVNVAFAGQTDMFYLTYTSSDLDGLDIIQSIVTVASADYNNKQINDLADQVSSTLDPTSRIKLLQQISQQVSKDIPDVPLYTETRHFILTKPYHLQTDIPSASIGTYFWQVYSHS
jgi:peptide/nickel transport system substrate-binding protein